MFCIKCFRPGTKVSNSRPVKKSPRIWRRRTCSHCGHAFTTYERPSLADATLILMPGGGSQAFNAGRLIVSVAASFTHDPDKGTDSALALAQTVEDILLSGNEALTPRDIAAVTHGVLRRFDEIAAVQYAARHGLIVQTRRRGRPSTSLKAVRRRQAP